MLINLYSLLLIGVTLIVVLSRRTMYAILYLILLFVLIAFVVLTWGVDFIGLIFIIVYVGAIATLFLFIVMMLGGEDWAQDQNLTLDQYNLVKTSGFRTFWLWGYFNKFIWYLKSAAFDLAIVFVTGLILLEIFTGSFDGNFDSWLNEVQIAYNSELFNTSYLYGVLFYNFWYLPFLLAAIVLLIAMLSSIILTTRLLILPKGFKKSLDSIAEVERKAQQKGGILQPMNETREIREKHFWKFAVVYVLWFGVLYLLSNLFAQIFIQSLVGRIVYNSTWLIIWALTCYLIQLRLEAWIKRKNKYAIK